MEKGTIHPKLILLKLQLAPTGGGRKEVVMAVRQGDLALLEHPMAKELVASNIPARLEYV